MSQNNSPTSSHRRRGRNRPPGGTPEGKAPFAAHESAIPAGKTQDEDGGEATETSGDTPTSSGAPVGDPALRVPADKTVVIGVTGEPGAGKSALARQLVALGGQLIDVDVLGHELLEMPAMKKALVKQFGDDVLTGDGDIDRRKLATKAFASAELTAALNAIMHPKLIVKAKLAAKKAGSFVIIDAALLHELTLGELCTTSVYVRASRESRLLRVAERGWDDGELARRETALGDADARRKRCNLAVDNSGDPALLAAYAKTILARQLGVDLASLRRQNNAPAAPAPSASADERQDEDETRSNDAPIPAFVATPVPPPYQAPAPRPFDGPRPHGQPGQPFQPNRFQQPQQPQQPQPPERPPVKVNLDDYLRRTLPDLQAEADKMDIRDVKWLKKHDLICEILRRAASGRQDEIVVEGFMEVIKDQQGYIRSPISQYLAVSTDTFVANPQIRRYGLKPGMQVTGIARAPRGNERCPQLLSIQTIMGEPENKRTPVQDFEHLTPLHAYERLFMELPNDPTDLNLRIIDLICPIGKGQRGLIVAQPKCGKTVYLQKIAKAITTNNPEVVLMVLLVDERPEEVTDMQRSVKGEVIASTFDQHASRHVQCAEMTINKAKRLVECGQHVVILLDSVTRLARAYNTEAPGSGRVMSGGIESGALIKPKQFFGAARKIENGGSLTILATALVDTGSLADTVIFEEFKGTGNMELVLDRRLADRRCFPAINIAASGTRKDDLLIKNEDELRRTWALRKFLADRSPQDGVEFLKGKLKNYKTNIEFLLTIDPEKMSAW